MIPWTPDEVALLKRMIVDDRMSYPEIAFRLDRTLGSVANKARANGLSTKRVAEEVAARETFPVTGLNLRSVSRVVAVLPNPGVSHPPSYREVSVPHLTFLEGFA